MPSQQKLTHEYTIFKLVSCDNVLEFQDFLLSENPINEFTNFETFFKHGAKGTMLLQKILENTAHPININEEITLKLKASYYNNYLRNTKIIQATCGIAKAFEGKNVELINIKGAALLPTLFKDNLMSRFTNDIDVIVRSADIVIAENILKELGFIEDYSSFVWNKKTHDRVFFQTKHFHYHYTKDDIHLELHWNLTYNENQKLLDELFKTRKIIESTNCSINICSNEFNIIILCLNFIHDSIIPLPNSWHSRPGLSQKMLFNFGYFCLEMKHILQNSNREIDLKLLFEQIRLSRESLRIHALLFISARFTKIKKIKKILEHSMQELKLEDRKILLQIIKKSSKIKNKSAIQFLVILDKELRHANKHELYFSIP